MSRSSLLAVALVASLPVAAGAQEAAYQGLQLDLSHLTGHPRQTDIQVFGTADLHFGEFRPFLVFNVADAAITIGVLILLARALLVRDKNEKPEVAENENA